MTKWHLDDIADRLAIWLEIDSTTGREAAYLGALEAYFAEADYDCRRQPVADERWNLLATRSDNPKVVFSTHVDTVPPYFGPRRDGDRIYGRGACDTKGGLLAMCLAAETLAEAGFDDVGFLLVVGEEVDHIGARVARDLEFEPERIILCEPTRNRVVSAQKGMLKFSLVAEGRAAHSAFPEEGDSAVHRLLDTIETIRGRGWPEDEILGPTTINIGTISGGVAANVLAPDARAEVLFRAVSAVDPILDEVDALCVDGVEIDDAVYNDPVFFEPPDGFDTCTVAFNTDATYLADLAPVWLVGPGDIRVAHSEDEHIELAALRDGAELYVDLARTVLA